MGRVLHGFDICCWIPRLDLYFILLLLIFYKCFRLFLYLILLKGSLLNVAKSFKSDLTTDLDPRCLHPQTQYFGLFWDLEFGGVTRCGERNKGYLIIEKSMTTLNNYLKIAFFLNYENYNKTNMRD